MKPKARKAKAVRRSRVVKSGQQGRCGGGLESLDDLRARGVVALTQEQMAVALQVSYRTISEMRRRREISFFRVGRKLVRFRVEEALRHMEAAGCAEIRSPKSEARKEVGGPL